MCECHQWSWLLVDTGLVFRGSLINLVGTSRERGVCGSHAGLGAMLCPWGVGGVGRESALAVTTIWVSQRLEEREWRSSDWLTSLLLHYHYFPSQSLRGDSGRLCTRKHIRFPPWNHMCAQTHVHARTQGRGSVVTTAFDREVRGYHYKWLTLTFGHPKDALITLALPVSHTCTWPWTPFSCSATRSHISRVEISLGATKWAPFSHHLSVSSLICQALRMSRTVCRNSKAVVERKKIKNAPPL